MYLEEDLEDYKYVVNYSDNYLVLSKHHRVQASYDNPDTETCLVKYFNPSNLSFTTELTFYSSRSFDSIQTSSNDLDRADAFNIFGLATMIIILTLVIYSLVSRLFVRGGLLR